MVYLIVGLMSLVLLIAMVVTRPAAAPRQASKTVIVDGGGSSMGGWIGRIRIEGGSENVSSVPPPLALPDIDPTTPLAELLPEPPKCPNAPVYLGDDLTRVPELAFEAAPPRLHTTTEWLNRKGRHAAGALRLNAEKEDGYLKAMLKDRGDLKGLPFAMGKACRTTGARAAAFKSVAPAVRRGQPDAVLGGAAAVRALAAQAVAAERAHYEDAHLAAVRQVMGPSGEDAQKAAVQYYSGVPRPAATAELARLAVFSTQQDVRDAAIEALSVRRERDVTGPLVEGLRYPWPAVARNAAAAIVRLGRKDLMPELAAMLDEPDPRAPRKDGEAEVAHEVVRVNHHRNCMLCHAPARRGEVPEEALVAEVPVPSKALPTNYYGESDSPLLVRIDTTYLRQDFSVMQEVKWAAPWPEVQRFDFLVRRRVLSREEADDLRRRLDAREHGVLSPYRKAAVEALREMTGRDLGADAGEWRKLLELDS
jgi:hypothetical protein